MKELIHVYRIRDKKNFLYLILQTDKHSPDHTILYYTSILLWFTSLLPLGGTIHIRESVALEVAIKKLVVDKIPFQHVESTKHRMITS